MRKFILHKLNIDRHANFGEDTNPFEKRQAKISIYVCQNNFAEGQRRICNDQNFKTQHLQNVNYWRDH